MTTQQCGICFDYVEKRLARVPCSCKLYVCEECWKDYIESQKLLCPICRKPLQTFLEWRTEYFSGRGLLLFFFWLSVLVSSIGYFVKVWCHLFDIEASYKVIYFLVLISLPDLVNENFSEEVYWSPVVLGITLAALRFYYTFFPPVFDTYDFFVMLPGIFFSFYYCIFSVHFLAAHLAKIVGFRWNSIPKSQFCK